MPAALTQIARVRSLQGEGDRAIPQRQVFRISEDEENPDQTVDGIVLDQDPSPGTEVSVGSDVTIVVAEFVTTTT